jgi:selenocysteine-specific elongation factor
VPSEALRTSTPRAARLEARVFQALLARLAAAGELTQEADLVRRKGFSPEVAESRRADLLSRVVRALDQAGLGPPSPKELALAVGAEAGAVLEALGILVRRGQAVRVKADLYFGKGAVDGLRDRLRAFLAERGQISAQEWKALVGASRKYAIPLAEHFDAEKVTLRVGEIRRLRLIPGAG